MPSSCFSELVIFVWMKRAALILLLGLQFFLSGCPGSQYQSALQKLQKNKMDLPNPKPRYFSGIRFRLSELFEDSYNSAYILKKQGLTEVIYELSLHFSVEIFSSTEASNYHFFEDNELDDLAALHRFYVRKRSESLSESRSSVRRNLPKLVGFKGYLQVINGKRYSGGPEQRYFLASVKIDDKIAVFQMIGKSENMAYLYDDFLEILNSIER